MEFRFLLGLVHADVISKTKKKLAQSTARNKEHLIHNHNNNICIFGCWSFFVVLFLHHFTLNAEMQIKSFTSVMSSTFTDRVSLILSSYGWPIGWLSSVYSDMIAFNVKQQSKLLLSIFLTLFFFILGRIISENNWIYFTSWKRVYLYFTLEAY